MYYNYDNNNNVDNKPEYNDNSNASDDARFDDNVLFDSKDNKSNDGTVNKDIDKLVCLNNGYNNDETNITIIKDINKCYTTELDKYK
jgi:hypothetical protein